jgi:uncharacterized protein (TIGR02246 family)
MRLGHSVLLCAPVLLVSFGCMATTARPAADASAQARVEITRARDAFWAAHERGDAKGLAMQLTNDAVLFAPDMGEVRGRTAIEDAARQMFAQLSVRNFKILSQELDICGDTAYELTTYSETLQPAGAAANDVRGRYLIVWRRDTDGAWRVHRNLFNFDASGGH